MGAVLRERPLSFGRTSRDAILGETRARTARFVDAVARAAVCISDCVIRRRRDTRIAAESGGAPAPGNARLVCAATCRDTGNLPRIRQQTARNSPTTNQWTRRALQRRAARRVHCLARAAFSHPPEPRHANPRTDRPSPAEASMIVTTADLPATRVRIRRTCFHRSLRLRAWSTGWRSQPRAASLRSCPRTDPNVQSVWVSSSRTPRLRHSAAT